MWYTIENRGPQCKELRIFGEIGFEVSAEQLVADLDEIDRNIPLHVQIHTPGGSVFDGLAIYNRLKAHLAPVTTEVIGMAASMGSIIMLAGDHRLMNEGSWVMIHNPASSAFGESKDLNKAAQTLDQFKSGLLDIYARNLKLPRDTISSMMDEETWFNAADAIAAGFAHEVTAPEVDVAANLRDADVTRFERPPNFLKEIKAVNTSQTNQKLANLEAEDQRKTEILAVFDGFPAYSATLHACLQDRSCTEAQARHKLQDAMKAYNDANISPTGGVVSVKSNVDGDTRQAFRDQLAVRMGAKPTDDMHPAVRNGDISRMGNKAIFEAVARSRGFTSEPVGGWLQQPGSDVPGITIDAANVVAAQAYDEAPETDRWTAENTANDFKTHNHVQSDITGFPKLESENEQIQYGKLSDKNETNSVDTYGVQIALSRQLLVNGEVENIGRLVTQIARTARSTQLDTLYNKLIANPTLSEDSTALFHANHSNLISGGGSVLGVAGLTAALLAMRQQTGLGGRKLGLTPAYLLVPAALEVTARQLIASSVDPSSSGADIANPFQNFVEVIVESRLDDDSATAWYLMANPNQVDTFEQLYLEGPAPRIVENDNTASGVLGTTWLAYFDHGVSPLDFRGMLKSAGA
ncbi:MAG: ATP-dependent Clp protease proteolytic subunit [Pseudomonadaceae bacterium]|nr:ATP-dependent Clp protease proteolytic subunit [Pseudomonadaceae bacterium]